MPTISTLTVDVEANTSKLKTGLKVAGAALGLLATGAAFAFKQFEDAEKISNQTAAALESTGHAARISQKDIEGMASRLSAMAGVDDELIQSGENLLLTFTNIKNRVGGEFTGTFDRATGVMLDMSVALGQDMKSSAIQLGKALNDPINGLTSLTRVGVSFDEQTKKQIETLVKHGNVTKAQALILDELTKEFGGSAQAQATATGKMSVAFGNLAETVGGLVAPAFEFLATNLQMVVEWLQAKLPEAIKSVVEWFQGLTDEGTKVADALGGVVEWFQKVWNIIKPIAQTVGKELVEAFTQTWRVLSSNLGPMLKALWNLLVKVWDIVGPLVKVWLSIQAIWIKIALEVLPVLIAIITKVIEWLAKIIEKALDVVTFFRDKFIEPIVNVFGRIVDAISKVIGWLREHLQPVWNAVFGAVAGFIGRAIEAMKTLIGWIKNAIEWLGQLGKGVGSALAGKAIEKGVIPPLPNLSAPTGPTGIQHGGVVTRTGLALVHKGEAFSGVNNEMGFGLGGGDIVIQVNGQTLARILRDELTKLGRRNVTAGIPA